MAKEKIFHLQRKSDGTDHLVRTSKESAALAAIAGNKWKARVASPDDIYAHFNAGRKLHPASAPEEKGNRFVILEPANDSVAEPVLIRAKNTGAALSLLTEGDVTCRVVDDETLVRLLGAGLQVIDLASTVGKGDASPSNDDAGSGSSSENPSGAAASC